MMYSIYLPKENSLMEPETYIDSFDLNDPQDMEDFIIMRERLLNAHEGIIILATRETGEDDN